jgi:hypothetical protein
MAITPAMSQPEIRSSIQLMSLLAVKDPEAITAPQIKLATSIWILGIHHRLTLVVTALATLMSITRFREPRIPMVTAGPSCSPRLA